MVCGNDRNAAPLSIVDCSKPERAGRVDVNQVGSKLVQRAFDMLLPRHGQPIVGIEGESNRRHLDHRYRPGIGRRNDRREEEGFNPPFAHGVDGAVENPSHAVVSGAHGPREERNTKTTAACLQEHVPPLSLHVDGATLRFTHGGYAARSIPERRT